MGQPRCSKTSPNKTPSQLQNKSNNNNNNDNNNNNNNNNESSSTDDVDEFEL